VKKRLRVLRFSNEIASKVDRYFEGVSSKQEHDEVRKLIVFLEKVLDKDFYRDI